MFQHVQEQFDFPRKAFLGQPVLAQSGSNSLPAKSSAGSPACNPPSAGRADEFSYRYRDRSFGSGRFGYPLWSPRRSLHALRERQFLRVLARIFRHFRQVSLEVVRALTTLAVQFFDDRVVPHFSSPQFRRRAYHRRSWPAVRQQELIIPRVRALAMCVQFQVSKKSMPLTVATAICKASSCAFGGSAAILSNR